MRKVKKGSGAGKCLWRCFRRGYGAQPVTILYEWRRECALECCLGQIGCATDLGNAAAVHSLPAGAGIWPPAFPPRSPRGKHYTAIAGIVLALAGCALPPPAGAGIWPPAFPPRSPRGPLQHKTGCWRTLFLYPPPPLCKQSLQRSLGDTKKPDDENHPVFAAEREGFEPPDPLRSTVFKTAAIDHSATSPSALGLQM